MKKKNSKKWALVLVLLLVVSIGYAALASNLKINGSSSVKSATWDVYWNNVQVTQGSVETTQGNQARITDQAKTQVEYSVTLNEPGDFYEFTVDAVNNGTIDAMIAANGIVDGVYTDAEYQHAATLPDAVSYTVTYADGTEIQDKHLLAKKNGNTPTTETYKVRIEYRNDDEIDPDDLDDDNDHTYYFKFSVDYVQADTTAEPSHQASAIRYVKRQNTGQITPGDVIGIGETEDFYVISSNSEKTVLLAKYNLLVGYNENIDDIYTIDMPSYGLQSIEATGYNGGKSIGTVAFSATNYWNSDDHYIYDNTYITAPDFENDGWTTEGYSIAYYVEQYKTTLIELGAPATISARLISYEEAESIKNIKDDDTNTSIIFDGAKAFWLGTSTENDGVYTVNNGCPDYGYTCGSSYEAYDSSLDYGVRPVIEIPTSEIK